jgi:hypothetical protein
MLQFQGCSLKTTGNIEILTVRPSSGLIEGTPTSFTIEVRYELSGSAQGKLNVGFNTSSIDSYVLVTSETTIVNEGSGQHTFNASGILPKNWAPELMLVATRHLFNPIAIL